MHGSQRNIISVGEDVSSCLCFNTIGFVLLEVHFTNQLSEFVFSCLGLAADGKVSKGLHRILVLCHGFRYGLGHGFHVRLCFFVIKEWAEGQLLCDVLSIVCNAVLPTHHVKEVIDGDMYTKSSVVHGQSSHF